MDGKWQELLRECDRQVQLQDRCVAAVHTLRTHPDYALYLSRDPGFERSIHDVLTGFDGMQFLHALVAQLAACAALRSALGEVEQAVQASLTTRDSIRALTESVEAVTVELNRWRAASGNPPFEGGAALN